MSLYGVNFKKLKNTYKQGVDADTCTAEECFRDHTVMMTDAATNKRYWLSVTGGLLSCTGANYDEVSSFGPWIRDRTSHNWIDAQGELILIYFLF